MKSRALLVLNIFLSFSESMFRLLIAYVKIKYSSVCGNFMRLNKCLVRTYYGNYLKMAWEDQGGLLFTRLFRMLWSVIKSDLTVVLYKNVLNCCNIMMISVSLKKIENFKIVILASLFKYYQFLRERSRQQLLPYTY